MRLLISPDKFKGSLNASQVADNIAAGLSEALPDAEIEIVPVADGGEGTAEVLREACGGKWVTCEAHDALGRPILAQYIWSPGRSLAVMEMSEAAGSRRIASDAARDPMRASTFGVGEMLRDAVERRPEEIIVGLGGSATNDGGFGMARALGFRFWDAKGTELTGPVSDLLALDRIDAPPALAFPRIIAAADVKNPLLGERGATRMFGPQKGASPKQMELLECALTRLADVLARDLRSDVRENAGAGAAGGLGFGLLSFYHATVRAGFDVVAEMVNLRASIHRADIVITGEGCLDAGSLEGKAPAGVAGLAREMGKRVYAIVGCAAEDRAVLELFDDVLPLTTPSIPRQEAMSRASELLRERARELGRTL